MKKKYQFRLNGFFLSLFLSALLVGLSGCAAQGSPSGGPEDKTGPQLLAVSLRPDSTGVKELKYIDFVFDEMIEPTSLVNSLRMTPLPENKPLVKARKKTVRVTLQDTLKPNTTYVLNFRRNIKDYRKNTTRDEVRLAFATGDTIDRGKIRGRLYNYSPEKTTEVWCWKMAEPLSDTLPQSSPEFIASVSAQGQFEISNLGIGTYRLLAVNGDGIKPNHLPKAQYGVCQTDPVRIIGRQDEVRDLRFVLTELDPAPVMISSVLVNRNKLTMKLTAEPDPAEILNTRFLADTVNRQIQSVWLEKSNPADIHILFDSLSQGMDFPVSVSHLKMKDGQIIPQLVYNRKIIFKAEKDTLNPKLSELKSDDPSGKYFTGSSLLLYFSKPLKTFSPNNLKITAPDSTPVIHENRWLGGNTLSITPVNPWTSNTEYQVSLIVQNWTDFSDSTFKDSLVQRRFKIEDKESFGMISGIVTSANIALNEIAIRVSQTDKSGFSKTVMAGSDGKFYFDSLLPGDYKVEFWHDKNHNQIFDSGRLRPFTPAEYYHVFDKAVSVRSRWEQADVELSL